MNKDKYLGRGRWSRSGLASLRGTRCDNGTSIEWRGVSRWAARGPALGALWCRWRRAPAPGRGNVAFGWYGETDAFIDQHYPRGE